MRFSLRFGNLYLSAQPRLELTAQGDDGSFGMMGDVVSGQTVKAKLAWCDCRDGERLRFVVDNEVIDEAPLPESGQRDWMLNTSAARWCTVEVRGAKRRDPRHYEPNLSRKRDRLALALSALPHDVKRSSKSPTCPGSSKYMVSPGGLSPSARRYRANTRSPKRWASAGRRSAAASTPCASRSASAQQP